MAGLLPPEMRERIRAANDIVEVIGGYLALKRAGANFTALCPFHREKTPSFHVNPQRQVFHCFGCHKGGDVFTFVQEYEHIGFMDALRRLADRARIPLEFTLSPEDLAARGLKEKLLEIHEKAALHWQKILAGQPEGQRARDYLRQRGVSEDSIRLFRLGAAALAWDDMVQWGRDQGFGADLMEQSGLVTRKAETGRMYDRFRGRLIFPISDENGRVVGFSARVLPGDDSPAKYMNSPETQIFSKGRLFYGLDKSKRAILDAGHAILCEGQLDLIACHSHGVTNVVAPQGTALTGQQARLLKRYTNEAVLCFDADNAGQNATVRSLDAMLEAGLALRVARIPEPHDPDTFIREKGAEQFRELIRQAPDFFDYFLQRLCQTNDARSDKGRLAILGAMAEALGKTNNEVLVDAHARKTALKLGVSPESVRTEFTRLMEKQSFTPPESETDEAANEPDEERPSAHELHLLKILLIHEEICQHGLNLLDLDWIQDPRTRAILTRLKAAWSSGQWPGLAAFMDDSKDDSERRLITEVATVERKVPNPEQQLPDLLLKLRNQSLDRQLVEAGIKMTQTGLSEAEHIESIKAYQRIRELKRQPLSPVQTMA